MSFNFWRKGCNRVSTRFAPCRRGEKTARRLSVEFLENRVTPAIDITAFDTTAGTVTFTGTAAADSLVLSQTVVDGEVLLSHNLAASGGSGNYADATDIDPSAGVAHLVLGTGTSPLITVNLGAGNDTFRLANAWQFLTAVNVDGGADTDTFIGPSTAQTWNVTGSSSGTLDNVSFTNFEKLQGGLAADTFHIMADFEGSIHGGPGADVFMLHVGVTSASIIGGAGMDTLDLSELTAASTVTLTGVNSAGFSGNVGGNTFAGINNIVGGQGADTLVGANVATVWNLDGTPTLTADGTTLSFSSFATLQGGSANDVFVISADTDLDLRGGAGHDVVIFSDDVTLSGSIQGGAGSDTIVLSGYSTSVTINLEAGTATGVTDGISGIENAAGGSGDDLLIGDSANNRLAGRAGDDILLGGAGNDVLLGGPGDDLLVGGAGADSLHGGAGEDILIGGSTTLSNDALRNLLTDWSDSDDRYQQRVNSLRDALDGAIVADNAVDTLTGGDDLDVFFYSKEDDLADINNPNGERRIRVA